MLFAHAERGSYFSEKKSSAVKPNDSVCTLAIPVGRKAYKAMVKLKARRVSVQPNENDFAPVVSSKDQRLHTLRSEGIWHKK